MGEGGQDSSGGAIFEPHAHLSHGMQVLIVSSKQVYGSSVDACGRQLNLALDSI